MSTLKVTMDHRRRRFPLLLSGLTLVLMLSLATPAYAAWPELPECHIRGTVTNGEGVGLEGVAVAARAGSFIYMDYTDATGEYDILIELYGCRWLVSFSGTIYDGVVYTDEFYNDADTPDEATLVYLDEADTIATGIDASLRAYPSLSGRITDLAGRPLPGAAVMLYLEDGQYWGTQQVDVSGEYEFKSIAPQGYKLLFSAPDGFVPEWYLDKPDPVQDGTVMAAADVVRLGLEQHVRLDDALLSEYPHITGTVSDGHGDAMEDVMVEAYDGDGEAYFSDYTDAAGEYDIMVDRPGPYRLAFTPSRPYVAEFYNDKDTLAEADPVAVDLDDVVEANATLSELGHITGTVTDSSGEPLAYVSVNAWRPEWECPEIAETDENGFYDIAGLEAGDYVVQFEPFHPYIGEWYDHKGHMDLADPVRVTIDHITSGIDAVLGEHTGDVVAPLTTPSATDDLWHQVVRVTLSPSDGAGSGVAYTMYSTDGGGIWACGTQATFRTTKRGGGSGLRTLLYYSTDWDGNAEQVRTLTANIDGRAPVTRDDAPRDGTGQPIPQSSPVTVTLTATDQTDLSGVAETKWALDGGSWQTGSAVPVSGIGSHWVGYYSTDNAGNREYMKWCRIVIVAPSVKHAGRLHLRR